MFRTRRFTEYVAWLSDAKDAAMNKTTEGDTPEIEKAEISVGLKWMYGINMLTNPPIQYVPFRSAEGKDDPSETQLLYTCGATVIVYNPHMHRQRYYLEHQVFFVVFS